MFTTYILHLTRSQNRLSLIDTLSTHLPDTKLIEAVDGAKLHAQQIADVIGFETLKPFYPFGLMRSEIGCILSHQKAWEAIANSDAPYGAVAEDDLVLDAGFQDALDLALAHMNENVLIRFPMHQRETVDSEIARSNDISLFRPKVIGVTASLYLLGRDAARKLLDSSHSIDRPVDTWLQMRWKTQVDSLTLWPTHIHSAAAEHGGSTIQAKKSAWVELSRTWKRYHYRSAITKLSARS